MYRRVLVLFSVLMVVSGSHVSGQDSEPKIVRSRMSLTATQIQGDSIELVALLRAKFGAVYEKIPYADIEFKAIGEEETLLGKSSTNVDGIAKLVLKKSILPLSAEGYINVSARFGGDSELSESESEANIRPASLSITPVRVDSSLSIQIEAIGMSEEGDMPIVDANVTIQVQRMVGMLKVGEGTTDDIGEAEIDFPGDLAGDDNGNIHVTAFIEDFEEYGNLSASTTVPWGRPVSSTSVELPRALWSPYPPTWLFVMFMAFLAIIWGHYVHVVIGLIQVRMAAKEE